MGMLVRSAAKRANSLLRRFGIKLARTSRPTRDFKDGLEHLKSFDFYPEVVIDVGVLTGTPDLYSTFPKSRFILFEPQVEFEPHMKALCGQYDMSYHLMALGPASGSVEFLVRANDPGASRPFDEAEADPPTARRLVPMRRLDEVLRVEQLGSSCLLKIDVEGFELGVLEGASGLLSSVDVTVIEVRFFRYHPRQAIVHEVLAAMAKHDFFTHDILDGGYRPQDGVLDTLDIVFVSRRFASRVSTTWTD